MRTLEPPEIWKVGEEGKDGQWGVGLAWLSPCLGLKK